VKFDPTRHELSNGFVITAVEHPIVLLWILKSLDSGTGDFLNQVNVDCFSLHSLQAE
jgi:hypothetical protein